MFEILQGLLGGLGLFLVGMWLMTDGLKLAAGDSLRELLNTWTNSRKRGFIMGFGFTSLVQSSSAVTVATIGFANAGILTLSQAIWVIFGSNVGTTMTGWIVALVGFKINMEAFALPLVGLGMLLRLTGTRSRRGAFGQALVGFGLFFLGIGVLKEAFDTYGAGISLPAVDDAGLGMLFVYVFFGVVLTTLMQSSSAAIVITLSAAESGMIPMVAAAAVVIGANLGTTTTAMLSVWGATPAARRVAASHVVFNLLTGVIALIIIMPMLTLIAYLQELFSLPTAAAASLALFHTVFNLLGVIIMIPLADKLVAFMSRRFVSQEEIISRPAFLDNNVLEVPAIAVVALGNELKRLHIETVDVVKRCIQGERSVDPDTGPKTEALTLLIENIAAYVTKISTTSLPAEVSDTLPRTMEYLQQLTMINDYLGDLMELSRDPGQAKLHDEQLNMLKHFQLSCGMVLEQLQIDSPEENATDNETIEGMEKFYDEFQHSVFIAGLSGNMTMHNLDILLQQLNITRRIVRQLIKATNRLNRIISQLDTEPKEEEVPESTEEEAKAA